jgi:hypothetical protein
MRYTIISIILACSSLSHAADDANTTAPGGIGTGFVPLKQGHFAAGIEYDLADVDVRTKEAFFGPVRLPPVTIKDVQIDRVFFAPSFALLDNLQLLGRVGASHLSVDKNENSNNLGGQQGTSDWDFSAAGGLKAVVYKQDRFYWTVAGLVTWTEFDDFNPWHAVFNGIPVTAGSMKLDLTDYQIATGPAYEILDGWTLSAGPYWLLIDAKAHVSAPVLGQKISTTVDIHEDEDFGGYISSQLILTRSAYWNVRFSATGSGYVFATNLSVAF